MASITKTVDAAGAAIYKVRYPAGVAAGQTIMALKRAGVPEPVSGN
ncbi:MAG: hypothetical protein ACLSBB_16130 [Ruthenibacterium lactatiformans]